MNNRFVDGWWPHGVGVVFATPLLFAVAALAAPNGLMKPHTDRATTAREVTHLVTGDPARINAVVAGGPAATAILAITPVTAKVGSYPPGTTIVGNQLRAEVGGFRAWFEVQLSNWDPNGDDMPALAVYQIKVDASGYLDSDLPGDQENLASAVVPCAADAECFTAFGESWSKCEGPAPLGDGNDFCKAGYLDKSGVNRPADNWCTGGCEAGDVITTSHNYNWYSVYSGVRSDEGIVYYGGTLVLDIPVGARGRYSVDLNHDETFLACGNCPPGIISTLAQTGFVVKIVTGQCCFGFGTSDEGCIDGVLRGECGDDEPAPFIFIPEGLCPPDGLDCSSFLGACCDTRDGSCEEWQPHSSCRGMQSVWTSGVTCGEAACFADLGVCCDTLNGQCQDQVFEFYCQGTQRVWSRYASCADVECTTQTGACCNRDPFGPCIDATVLSDCQCAACAWHKLQTCAEIECSPTPIPTVSEWGLVVLTLLLLTGAKVLFPSRASSA